MYFRIVIESSLLNSRLYSLYTQFQHKHNHKKGKNCKCLFKGLSFDDTVTLWTDTILFCIPVVECFFPEASLFYTP